VDALASYAQVLPALPDGLAHQRHRRAYRTIQLGAEVVAVGDELRDCFLLGHDLVHHLGALPRVDPFAEAIRVRRLEQLARSRFDYVHRRDLRWFS
jgi:hypothetical protein